MIVIESGKEHQSYDHPPRGGMGGSTETITFYRASTTPVSRCSMRPVAAMPASAIRPAQPLQRPDRRLQGA